MLSFSCSMWDLFPDQELNLGLLQWEQGVLDPGPPGKTPSTPNFKFMYFEKVLNNNMQKLHISMYLFLILHS